MSQSKNIITKSNEKEDNMNQFKQILLNFTNGHREIVFNSKAYSMSDEYQSSICLEEIALCFSQSAHLPGNQLTEWTEEILGHFSTSVREFSYKMEHALSFVEELRRTILYKNQVTTTSFLETYRGNGIHIIPDILGDSKGNYYPLWMKVCGFEDGLCYTMLDMKPSNPNLSFQRKDAFDYFLNTDGYPLWANLCQNIDEVIACHRLFFDLHYEDFVKEYNVAKSSALI